MKNRMVFTALAAVAVLAIVAVFVAKTVTPASAQKILDRAYQAQNQTTATQGIEHIRNEIYSNLEGKPDGQGMDSIIESYSDPANGDFRVVIADKQTGVLQDVYAFDGSNVYTNEGVKGSQPGTDALTVYRVPQNRPSLRILLGSRFANGNNGKLDAAQGAEVKNLFDKMRRDPHVELLGQETWENGHPVYVLRSQQRIRLSAEDQLAHPMGLITLYFDADTYQLLGSRVSIERNGKEVLISLQRTLLDEILPVGSHIAWDLSDLQGITIVDDPNGEHSVPEEISPKGSPVKALAAKTDSAYLLKTVPDGFSLSVSVLPKQPADQPFFYEAGYTNQAGDYFIIRTFGDKPLEDTSWAFETYTTASGLVLYFVNQPSITTIGEEFNGGLMQTPNGKTFAIESSLPLEKIKTLMDELVLVR